MNIAEVKELLTIVNDSKLTEFDLQMDNVVLHMSKNTHQAPKEMAAPQAQVLPKSEVMETLTLEMVQPVDVH
ncbi:acetyl-CoA carboxylase, biotin carboxyl carrier protein, partial [Carnobacterium maltaromaticum]